jgi:glucosamine--fructose-6-phosphate aminotransferase (isomerizing)
MCGIIGIIGIIAREAVAAGLLEGLRRLEYRGYDSAGMATLVDGHIECRRAEGKLVNLATRLDHEPVHGVIGIGHTRWATPWPAHRVQRPSDRDRPGRRP